MQRFLLSAVTALLVSSACREDVPEQRYELDGKIVSVDSVAGTVTVDHREVEGFMAAMTMPFPLKDRWAFDRLQPGDGVSAILVVKGKDYWLEGVVISRSSANSPEGPEEGEENVTSGPALGTDVPDVALVNQFGEPIRLANYRGKALMLTFIYTRCPLVEFCPRMTHHFGVLESKLSEDPVLYEKTHLLTISFDPEYDTPEKLETYAWQQALVRGETLEHWEFAAADGENLKTLSSFFGLTVEVVPDQPDQIVHNLRTALVGPDGKLVRVYRGNEWRAEEVFSDLEALGLGSEP